MEMWVNELGKSIKLGQPPTAPPEGEKGEKGENSFISLPVIV